MACSIVPGRPDWVLGLTNPVMGRPDWVTGLKQYQRQVTLKMQLGVLFPVSLIWAQRDEYHNLSIYYIIITILQWWNSQRNIIKIMFIDFL